MSAENPAYAECSAYADARDRPREIGLRRFSERGVMRAPKIPAGRSRRRIGERQRTAWLYAAEMETLRMITEGASLTDILTHVCASIDRQISPSITTILLMEPDGVSLRPIAGPKVPVEWTRAISPVLVAPDAGLCSTASALKTLGIVPAVA